MSEPRLIEPLLSEHIMGEPISDHCGVRCCPAIHKDSEEKYMVKILSIPANEKQLAALVLSGACKDRQDANRYFKTLADEAIAEAEVLQKLSRLEGFRGPESWQIEPMENGNGYDVYLLSTYGRTLERYLRRNPMTHLGAVNLGLDLCAALSVCRRNGYLYVDLKPENIFLNDNQGYLIGDLGFIRLSSLKYASLPDKYRSAYTAPEIEDAYSSLNSTLDIYAVGLILYQVYNNGALPAADESIAPPEYADYEMAEIILKACAADPADRWQDPQEMGQALVSYMQRNAVNDDPIIPPVIPAEPEIQEITDPEPVEEETADTAAEDVAVEEEPNIEEDPSPVVEQDLDAVHPEEVPSAEEVEPMEEVAEEEVAAAEDTADDADEEEICEEAAEIPEETAAEEPTEPAAEESEAEEEQILMVGFAFEDSAEDDVDLTELEDAPLTDEVSQMLAQADELIAHQAPDPVVAPEPIDVPIPEPILPEPEEEETPAIPPISKEETEEIEDIPVPQSDETEEEPAQAEEEEPVEPAPAPAKKRKLGRIIAILLLVLILACGGIGGKYYYDHEYLQHVNSVTLEHAEDWLIVTLDTEIDNSLLTVSCTDTYGNKQTQKVVNNQATFTSLPSGTTYKITVNISGKHQLTGNTTATFTTPAQTTILDFAGITGDSDGSVILNFSVQGPDASGWLVKYSTEGEQERTAVCNGHMALITDLTPGKTYSFRLVAQDDLYVVSGDTLEFTASKVIFAENLTIHGFDGGVLKATWDIPEGAAVESWTVRCYNSLGTDLTFTVTEPTISIEGLDIAQGYTIDVLASGMTVSKSCSISANSISIKDILLDESVEGQLSLSWNFEGTAPEGGWNLIYTVDGGAPVSVVCEKNSFTLTELVSCGHYTFELVFSADTTVTGQTGTEWDAPIISTEPEVNDVTISDLKVDDSVLGQLTLNWSYQGTAPEGGWTLVYTIDGSAPITVVCEDPNFTLTMLIPDSHYVFELIAPEGTVFSGTTNTAWDSPKSQMFTGHKVTAQYMRFRLCIAPNKDNWSWSDISDSKYTTKFKTTDKMGIVIRLTEEYDTSPKTVVATYVIRDENGAFVSIRHTQQSWTSMWWRGYCELTLPELPDVPGNYTLQIYLDGAYITIDPIAFTVS